MATAETPIDDIRETQTMSWSAPVIVSVVDDEAAVVDNLMSRRARVLTQAAFYRMRIAGLSDRLNILRDLAQRKHLKCEAFEVDLIIQKRATANAIAAGRAHKATIKTQRLTIFNLESEVSGLERTNALHLGIIDAQAARIKSLENEVEQLKIRVRDDSAIIDSFAAQIKALTGPESELFAPAIAHSAADNLG